MRFFRQLDPRVAVHWQVRDGERVKPNQALFHLEGPARSAAHRRTQRPEFPAVALRRGHSRAIPGGFRRPDAGEAARHPQTLPGLRLAQKYAVTCGGCRNRIGLYDAFLIKENHIAACGGISRRSVPRTRLPRATPVEIEVESLAELKEALAGGADIIMLDELSLDDMREAVRLNGGKAKLEASGGINESTLLPIAETRVDYISIGAMTGCEGCRSVDAFKPLITPC